MSGPCRRSAEHPPWGSLRGARPSIATHITKTELLSRAGWTTTLADRLLGEPDQRKKVWGRTIPAALYAIARVERVEAGVEFASAQAAIAKRRMAAAKAVASKTAKLMAAIHSMPITVQRLNLSGNRNIWLISTLAFIQKFHFLNGKAGCFVAS